MSFRYQSSYIVKSGDDLGSATYWNTRFQDIDLRLNFTESYSATINTAADNVTAVGIDRINNTLNPFMNSIIAQIATLSTSIDGLQGQIIADQDSVVIQLNALLAQGQTLIANLQSLGTISDGTF